MPAVLSVLARESPVGCVKQVLGSGFAQRDAKVAFVTEPRERGNKMLRNAMVGLSTLVFAMACGADPSNDGPRVTAESELGAATKFYVPPPPSGATQQVKDLLRKRQWADAANLAALLATPQAVWFESGSPSDVKAAVQKTMAQARCEHRVPILVAYNLPFRDCSQYSAGGAADTAAYEAWIDGFAAGIGNEKAVVILEPDGLGVIPYNTNLDGSTDWCKPTVTDAQGNTVPAPGADPSSRYAQLNYAVDSIAREAPKVATYLDGTHSAWLNVGEATYRLTQAGVARARGFFLNVSNYQYTANLAQYGTWLSNCLAYTSVVSLGDYNGCPNQYWNGGPLPSKIAQINGEWTGTALDKHGEWSDATDTVALNTSGINLRYANMLGSVTPAAHFVIDTGRNGNGPLDATQYAVAPYNQSASVTTGLDNGAWCNAPSAGSGIRTTSKTGVAMLDAYLWIKTPGESDGSCDVAGGARAWDFAAYNPWSIASDAQDHFDPLWGIVDPNAGVWFPAQALKLAQLANPPLL
jgi:endoglucanase